jgi:hypothetical protein
MRDVSFAVVLFTASYHEDNRWAGDSMHIKMPRYFLNWRERYERKARHESQEAAYLFIYYSQLNSNAC